MKLYKRIFKDLFLLSHLLEVKDWGYEQVGDVRSGSQVLTMTDIFQWTVQVAPEHSEEQCSARLPPIRQGAREKLWVNSVTYVINNLTEDQKLREEVPGHRASNWAHVKIQNYLKRKKEETTEIKMNRITTIKEQLSFIECLLYSWYDAKQFYTLISFSTHICYNEIGINYPHFF